LTVPYHSQSIKDAAAYAKERLNELRTEGCGDVVAKDAAAYAKEPQRSCV